MSHPPRFLTLVLLWVWTNSTAEAGKSIDAASAFGARPSVTAMRLSPDGMNVTYVASTKGRGSIAYTVSLAKGSAAKPALSSDGKPLRLEGCHWVSNDRIVCLIYAVTHDGSPIEHADKIKVPVLLFHAGHDANVNIAQSKSMAARLKAAGGKCELVTWDDLDHQLDDSDARAQMLTKSEQFLREALRL